jgi:hypothetical protein
VKTLFVQECTEAVAFLVLYRKEEENMQYPTAYKYLNEEIEELMGSNIE